MRTALLLILVSLTAALSAGCNTPRTDVQLTGSLVYGDCGEVLPWEPRFASWAEIEATDAVMRFQSSSNNLTVENDALLFVINDAFSLFQDPTVAIEVGDREYDDARASANLTLPVTCPDDTTLSVYLHGTLTFEELSPKRNGPIRGTFLGEARDQRTQEVLGSSVQLHFDFERSARTPWQVFSN